MEHLIIKSNLRVVGATSVYWEQPQHTGSNLKILGAIITMWQKNIHNHKDKIAKHYKNYKAQILQHYVIFIYQYCALWNFIVTVKCGIMNELKISTRDCYSIA